MMSQEQFDIYVMQCWVFRHTKRKWSMTARKFADMIQQYDL